MLAIFIGPQWAVASSYSSLASRLDRLAYGHAGDAAPVREEISELRIGGPMTLMVALSEIRRL
jgi:hypothetical protein